jgi:hypothetical protein
LVINGWRYNEAPEVLLVLCFVIMFRICGSVVKFDSNMLLNVHDRAKKLLKAHLSQCRPTCPTGLHGYRIG